MLFFVIATGKIEHLERMQENYLQVHAYKVKEIYGRNPQPVSEVLLDRYK